MPAEKRGILTKVHWPLPQPPSAQRENRAVRCRPDRRLRGLLRLSSSKCGAGTSRAVDFCLSAYSHSLGKVSQAPVPSTGLTPRHRCTTAAYRSAAYLGARCLTTSLTGTGDITPWFHRQPRRAISRGDRGCVSSAPTRCKPASRVDQRRDQAFHAGMRVGDLRRDPPADAGMSPPRSLPSCATWSELRATSYELRAPRAARRSPDRALPSVTRRRSVRHSVHAPGVRVLTRDDCVVPLRGLYGRRGPKTARPCSSAEQPQKQLSRWDRLSAEAAHRQTCASTVVASSSVVMVESNVLALVEWYLPGERAGGPVRSIDALVHRLEGRVHFDVVTRGHDFGDATAYPGVVTDTWITGGPERRRYLSRRGERPLVLLRLLRQTPHDVLYLNTLYSLGFALYPLLWRRVGLLHSGRTVLAPRGQLAPGALAIGRFKKRAYLLTLRATGLFRDLEWHAASAEEEGHIRRLVADARTHVAPNLRRPTVAPVGAASRVGGVRAIFLSRIAETKNLDGALRILLGCTVPVEFNIYGQQEDVAYWRKCCRLIVELPENVTCTYHGAVAHQDVAGIFADHDVLLLPTHGESFGHVIGEALEAGCVAIVSDRTPWRGLTARRAGWDLPLDDSGAFTAALEEYASFDETQRARWREGAREVAARRNADQGDVVANVRLLAASRGTESRKTRRTRAICRLPAKSARPGRLLLLSPSKGLGGGIERVMDAVEQNWSGPVQRVDLLRAAPQAAGNPVTRPAMMSFVARVISSASLYRPAVILCGLLGLLPVAAFVALPFRRKLALLTYGVDVWGPIARHERILIRRCARLLTISAFTADVFGARAGVDPSAIDVLALPIAEGIAAGAQAPVADHTRRPPIVLTVSRITKSSPAKGHFDIARCFGKVLERRPDARWVVVGDGDDLPSLRSTCNRLRIAHAVTFTGHISDAELMALYGTASVFALPSFADANAEPPVGEGFGLVYVEAGAFGLPVIASTAGGGSADFVVEGETGLTVRPKAPDELADAIVRLLNSDDLRNALGQRAREVALSRHLPVHFRDALQQSLT